MPSSTSIVLPSTQNNSLSDSPISEERRVSRNGVWNHYWQARELNLENPQGKSRAIEYARKIINTFPRDELSTLRIAEFGCGEGHILNRLYQHFNGKLVSNNLVGIDRDQDALKSAEKLYPNFTFLWRNFLYPDWKTNLGQFNVIMMVNVLHEIFSSEYMSEIDIVAGKKRVKQVMSTAVDMLSKHGYLLIFDGIEYDGDIDQRIHFSLVTEESRRLFYQFVQEYRGFRIRPQEEMVNGKCIASLSKHDFSKFITKLKWLNSELWEIEKWESYQYFNIQEFIETMTDMGLTIRHQELLAENIKDWEKHVRLEDPGSSFPYEHVLIAGRK